MDFAQEFPQGPVHIDLPNQSVSAGNHSFSFDVDSFRKHCLLNGLDDIGLTLEKATAIDNFEDHDKKKRPWLYAS
jgi:3-isopropylmalate/(R)-2-methylmalate dehydratase small subunit